jgi:hypothetical protein
MTPTRPTGHPFPHLLSRHTLSTVTLSTVTLSTGTKGDPR